MNIHNLYMVWRRRMKRVINKNGVELLKRNFNPEITYEILNAVELVAKVNKIGNNRKGTVCVIGEDEEFNITIRPQLI